MPKRLSSAVLWQGSSLLTGAPIVAVITGLGRPSKNAKTGAMAQVFILRSDIDPVTAVRFGYDDAICGYCKHRGTPLAAGFGRVTYSGRSCYVTVVQSPNAVYKAFKRGSYPVLSPAEIAPLLADRPVRLGAYGDPAAVPANVWTDLIKFAPKHSGYTHQWREPSAAVYRPFLMASVDSPAEFSDARSAEWRTFRVRTQTEDLTPLEVSCPASEESGHRTTCGACGLCSGADKGAKSIAILAHGTGAANFISLQSLKAGR
jgi:hypothetical protein